jgi:hypothetical protein
MHNAKMDSAHVYQNIMAILIVDVAQNVFRTASAQEIKLVCKINVAILVQEFADKEQLVRSLIIPQFVNVL